MASFAGAFAASHGPLIIREWDAMPAGEKSRLKSAFEELGRRLKSARPDALIVVSPDHWSNFFLDNYPAVCLGVGAANEGPPEPWMKAFAHRDIAGHPALAAHIVEEAMRAGFEPSVSHRLKLDHGFCIPLWKSGFTTLPPIVPIIFNDLEPPFPSVKRCYAWGTMLAQAIRTFPGETRVAILGTGGLSHSIGEPTMGEIDEAFDRACIGRFEAGDPPALIDFLNERLPTQGNGSAEIRNWVAAHGAAGGRGFDLIRYDPIPEVYVGCGFASWKV